MPTLENIEDFRRGEIRDQILGALNYAFKQNSPVSRIRSFFEMKKDLDVRGKIIVIGFGKAAKGMYEGVKACLGLRISDSHVIIPGSFEDGLNLPLMPGNHPLPGLESLNSSAILVDSLKNLSREDLVIAVISGGGSSLFEVLRDGVDLAKYNSTVNCLMKNGASISELNAVRYLFSDIKGGGLLKYAYPAGVLSLIISDVPGDDVSTVASGPTADPPDPSLIEKTIEKFHTTCDLPPLRIEQEEKRSTGENHIILKNSDFVETIKARLEAGGNEVFSLGSAIEGNTTVVANRIVTAMRDQYETRRSPLFVVGGGETSTEREGNGIGGRNLELCLRVILEINEGEELTFGSFGTDGIDGSSQAMGAVVDNSTLDSLTKDYIRERLSHSESLAPLKRTHDVIFTGLTGTNVSDIFVGYYAGRK